MSLHLAYNWGKCGVSLIQGFTVAALPVTYIVRAEGVWWSKNKSTANCTFAGTCSIQMQETKTSKSCNSSPSSAMQAFKLKNIKLAAVQVFHAWTCL